MQIRYNYVPDEHADHVIYSQTMLQVEGYCASVVIIIANVLSDGEHLTPILSHDLPLLEGLFDILPLISDDNEARNAFWCILTRLLQQVEGETITNSSKLEQFVSIFLAKFTLMKDDIERHGIQTEADSSVEGVSLKNGLRTSVSFIRKFNPDTIMPFMEIHRS